MYRKNRGSTQNPKRWEDISKDMKKRCEILSQIRQVRSANCVDSLKSCCFINSCVPMCSQVASGSSMQSGFRAFRRVAPWRFMERVRTVSLPGTNSQLRLVLKMVGPFQVSKISWNFLGRKTYFQGRFLL